MQVNDYNIKKGSGNRKLPHMAAEGKKMRALEVFTRLSEWLNCSSHSCLQGL